MVKTRILLRAAFRKQKGTFIGIALLMLLVSVGLFTSITLITSGSNSVAAEMERLGYGTFTAWVNGHAEELRTEIEALPDTDKVIVQPLVFAGYHLGGKYSDNEGQLIVYDGSVLYRFVDDEGKQIHIGTVLPGQIYLSPAMQSSFDAKVGDTITFELSRGAAPYALTVAGWFEDAFMGSSMIDMKSFLISSEDDANIRGIIASAADYDVLGKPGAMLHVFQKAESGMTAAAFGRLAQTGTRLSRYTEFTYSKASILSYMLLLQNILGGFLLAFSLILLLVCLIVAGHSLSAVMDQEQRSMAILKTMGMQGGDIRKVYLLLYGGMMLCGLVPGMVMVLPLSHMLAKGMLHSTGMLISVQLPILWMLLILFAVLILCGAFLILRTKRIMKIAPMQALRKPDRAKTARTPLGKKALTLRIALREVCSGKRRYLGLMLIAALLTMFLCIIGRMGNWLGPNGEGLMNAFSVANHDLGVQPFNAKVPMDEIERAINWYSPWTDKYALAMEPVTVNGQAYTANVLDNARWFHVLQGDMPQFNSILITDTVSHELGVGVGDLVTVAKGGRSAEYQVSGIYQCANGMGSNIGMTVGGYARVGDTDGYIWCYHYILEKGDVREFIMDFLQGYYRGIAVHTNRWSGLDGIVSLMHGLIVLIYFLAAVLILVAVLLSAGKILQAETGTLAVYKSLGLSDQRLRLSFTFRFLLVVIAGTALGSLLALCCADPLIRRVFALFGIGSFSSSFSFLGTLLPPVAVTLLFFLFSWLFSAKLKRVSMIQLISEYNE